MKKLDDMTLDELTDWASGTLILGIGKGDFRGELSMVVQAMLHVGFKRGEKIGVDIERNRHKPKKAKKK